MKFFKTLPQLTDAVQCILHIYERSIINLGGLEEVEMHELWRQGVLEILEVLESFRPIANRTDTVLPMLISVDMYIHWMENMGLDGMPFPKWKKALFPDDNSITGHPWLLTVEHRYDTMGWQLQKPQATLVQEATTSAMTTPILPPLSVGNVRRTPHTSVRRWQRWMKKSPKLSMDGPKNEQGQKSKPEGRPGSETPLTAPKPKYGQAQFMDHTTPPPDPESCRTCVSHKVICTRSAASPPHLIAEILLIHARHHVNQMMPGWIIPQHHPPEKNPANLSLANLCWGRDGKTIVIPLSTISAKCIDYLERQVVQIDGHIPLSMPEPIDERMRIFKQELADTRWDVTVLTGEMETLHVHLHGTLQVQDNVGEAQDEDLIDLLGPDVEVDATITSGNEVTTLQGTPPTQSCETNSSTSVTAEESSTAIQVTEEQGDAIMEEVH
ncbi:hypothetical protein EDC04DRAFT_2605136 [Pisolithus marmoratus]|nr:hypothetical protein EDC04DRAFT_2605136 [Pisolithus marmoratus]